MSNYQRIFVEGYCYFLTVVTHQRNPILVNNIDLLRESFRASKTKYSFEIKNWPVSVCIPLSVGR